MGKFNPLGIIAGILAFVTFLMPWWTMDLSGTGVTLNIMTIYPLSLEYPGGIHSYTWSEVFEYYPTLMPIWAAWLAMLGLGALLAIIGSAVQVRALTIVAGVFLLVSVLLHVVFTTLFINTLFHYSSGALIDYMGSDSAYGITLSWGPTYGMFMAAIAAILAIIGGAIPKDDGI